jgi:hypothetical protein
VDAGLGVCVQDSYSAGYQQAQMLGPSSHQAWELSFASTPGRTDKGRVSAGGRPPGSL